MTEWCLPGCHQYFTQMFQAWHLLQSPNMANCLGVGLHHSTTTSFKSASGLGGVFFSMLNRLNTLLVLWGGGQEEKKLLFFFQFAKRTVKRNFSELKVPPHSPPSPSDGSPWVWSPLEQGSESLEYEVTRGFTCFSQPWDHCFFVPRDVFLGLWGPLPNGRTLWLAFLCAGDPNYWDIIRGGPPILQISIPVDDFFGTFGTWVLQKNSRESSEIQGIISHRKWGIRSSSAESDLQTSPQYHCWQR